MFTAVSVHRALAFVEASRRTIRPRQEAQDENAGKPGESPPSSERKR